MVQNLHFEIINIPMSTLLNEFSSLWINSFSSMAFKEFNTLRQFEFYVWSKNVRESVGEN